MSRAFDCATSALETAARPRTGAITIKGGSNYRDETDVFVHFSSIYTSMRCCRYCDPMISQKKPGVTIRSCMDLVWPNLMTVGLAPLGASQPS